ncbi:CubicO group peptidase (beta-lactamase class C family) [Jejuia pallidilutea]|uniref:CubicO group peptidase (Beta-lactamase class C family) n=1 Tax=Jejuia pallidilutea TaxID=504487 RepID=A0A362X0S2_9FLAO|nr:serine hydrolase domain-containing protein [Jejuia pallidilutea]PQV48319.1 CubicO group peptidase (beta-lactamase class C family) [Jejuia pallidilutea]
MNKLIILICIFSTQFAFGQTDQFDEILNYYNSANEFNGTVVVATDGHIDYLKAIGLSDRQQNKKIKTKTKFKIASITKAFTAVLILQLYEQGKIDLNTPFGKYFPTYKGNTKNYVTIQHLLTYSSGIPDKIGKLEMEPFKSPMNIDDFINKYCSSDIVGNTGEQSHYSNTEYIILTKIIEVVTQKKYETVLKENILKPLKMNNSGLLNSKRSIKGLAKSYSINDSTKIASVDELYFVENYFGAGAMYSTAEDLLKFNLGIFKNKLLNESNTKLMIKPNPKLNNVAFGVWYADGYGTFSKPFIYRTGGILGACTNWIYTLVDKKSIIVFNNTNGTNLYEMSEQFYLVSTGQKSNITKDRK